MPALAKLSKSEIVRLSKEIVPFSSELDMRLRGASVVGNPDPVLRYMAMKGEEAYRIMERNEPKAIGAARQQRDSRLLSDGSEIRPGRSRKPAALMLAEWAIDAFKSIRNWSAVEKRMLDALYWGWRPMEVQWRTDFRWKRKTYWVMDYIREKNPEDFRFTENRELVLVDKMTGEFTVFNRPGDELKWIVCTHGSNNNPYGEALYRDAWILSYAKSRFQEMFFQGMQRSLGVLHVHHGFTHPAGPEAVAMIADSRDPNEVMSSITEELREVINYLHQNNILYTRGGNSVSLLSDISFSDGWIKALEYLDDAMSLFIQTEVLSSREGSSGSRGQSVTHDKSGNRTARLDARMRDEWVQSEILERLIRVNFGDDVDRADMPEFISTVRNKRTLEDVKRFVDMGAKVDGDSLARDYGIPLAGPDTEHVLKATVMKTGPTRRSTEDAESEADDENEKAGRKRRKGGSDSSANA